MTAAHTTTAPTAPPTGPKLLTTLSEREMQIVRLLAEGLSDPQIGEQLYLAADTVKTHLRRINHKWGTNGRTHIVTTAFRYGLLQVHAKPTESAIMLAAGRMVNAALSTLTLAVTSAHGSRRGLPVPIQELLATALAATDQLQAAVNAHLVGGDDRD